MWGLLSQRRRDARLLRGGPQLPLAELLEGVEVEASGAGEHARLLGGDAQSTVGVGVRESTVEERIATVDLPGG